MDEVAVRDRVQQAAVELFAEKGYAPTSVQEVVARAGVTKGAMYHYFRSKDDLLFGIYDRVLQSQKERLDQIVARGLPAREALRAVCLDLIGASIDHRPDHIVVVRSRHLLTPARRREVDRRRREFEGAFSALIRRGQLEGIYRSDIPLPVLAASFIADLNHLPEWCGTSAVPQVEVAEQITELFMRGIAA